MKDEMDILREVGSIAAGHGSIALSGILGTKIDVEMPSLDVVNISQISQKISGNNTVISVACNILSGIKGEIVFVLEEKSAFKLVDLCYRVHPEDKKGSIFTEIGLSVIKEVGNVIISSYVGALSMILKTIVIPSIPTLVSGSIQQAMNIAVASYLKESSVFFTEAVFVEPNSRINGSFYLILPDESMLYIKNSCKKQLESLG